jgi:hypothetical protein
MDNSHRLWQQSMRIIHYPFPVSPWLYLSQLLLNPIYFPFPHDHNLLAQREVVS